jgi:hypothetical protein
MINNYLKQNNTTLKEIWERNKDRMKINKLIKNIKIYMKVIS